MKASLIYSKSTEKYAEEIGKSFKRCSYHVAPNEIRKDIFGKIVDGDIVIGIGGGTVIDAAKILSGDRCCIAIPTTAAGACRTPYATVWGIKKESVQTQIPNAIVVPKFLKGIPQGVLISTSYDALSHAIESYWSQNGSPYTLSLAKTAMEQITDQINKNYSNIELLVKAGNMAGDCIAITHTNIVHATSYTLTIRYGIPHGLACGMLLPKFIKYMGISLPSIPNKFPEFDKRIDIELLANESLKYKKINHAIKKIDKKSLVDLLEEK